MLNQSATLDPVFRALGDPTRREMVERLSLSPASVSQLAEPLGITLSAVLQQLAILEESGLVRSEKVGRVRTCRLEPDAFRTAEAWFRGQRALWERRLDRLGQVLGEDEQPEQPEQHEQRPTPKRPRRGPHEGEHHD